jgi:hypothetical protein
MVDYSNPFLTSFLGSRNQFTQPQNQFSQPQNQYDFSGWGDRLGKIEEGIASLTDQFKNFQTPGDVAPEYTGNAAPEPLEQTANAPEPLGGIESLVAEPTPPMGGLGGQQGPLFDPAPPGTVQLGGPNAPPPGWTPGGKQDDMNFTYEPRPTTPMGGQSLTRRGPLSLTEKLQNEYLMGTKGPLTMGGEWDARAKEMGFDFAEHRRQGHKGRLSSGWDATHQFNKLFEEAGGVLDRPEQGAAARFGEGFTNWLGDQGYEVYTEPQQEWMTQGQGLGALGQQQDMSGYTPHLSQYAMTAEEMQDPTGTLEARRENLYQPSGDVGGFPGFEELNRLRGGELDPNITNWSNFQQQGGTFAGTPPGVSNSSGQLQQLQALQAGIGAPALQGPTQQKIQQGIGALV